MIDFISPVLFLISSDNCIVSFLDIYFNIYYLGTRKNLRFEPLTRLVFYVCFDVLLCYFLFWSFFLYLFLNVGMHSASIRVPATPKCKTKYRTTPNSPSNFFVRDMKVDLMNLKVASTTVSYSLPDRETSLLSMSSVQHVWDCVHTCRPVPGITQHATVIIVVIVIIIIIIIIIVIIIKIIIIIIKKNYY